MRWFRRRKRNEVPEAPTPAPEPEIVPLNVRDPLGDTPFATPMTPRQVAILDFGWEIMKHSNAPQLFLWLAQDGWQGGHELRAWQHGPGQVAVKIKPWETLVLANPYSLN